jgi:hypothetical protein
LAAAPSSPKGKRIAACRAAAFHGHHAVDQGRDGRESGFHIEDHAGKVVAVAAEALVGQGFTKAGHTPEQVFDSGRQPHLVVAFEPGDVDDVVGLQGQPGNADVASEGQAHGSGRIEVGEGHGQIGQCVAQAAQPGHDPARAEGRGIRHHHPHVVIEQMPADGAHDLR